MAAIEHIFTMLPPLLLRKSGSAAAETRAGSIRGTLGLLYDYPVGRVHTLEINSKKLPTDGWVPYPVTQRWIPHAFIGTMGSVLSAIATGSAVRSSLADNVNTVKLVDALYRSFDSGQAVEL